jgi:hypothetical protein
MGSSFWHVEIGTALRYDSHLSSESRVQQPTKRLGCIRGRPALFEAGCLVRVTSTQKEAFFSALIGGLSCLRVGTFGASVFLVSPKLYLCSSWLLPRVGEKLDGCRFSGEELLKTARLRTADTRHGLVGPKRVRYGGPQRAR